MKLILPLIAVVLLLSGCITPEDVNVTVNYNNQTTNNVFPNNPNNPATNNINPNNPSNPTTNNINNVVPNNNQNDSIRNSNNYSDYGTTNSGGNSPYISGTTVGPSNPDRGQRFNITVRAEDTEGLQGIYWESSDTFATYPESASFECNSQTTCNITWTFVSSQDGLKTINVYAMDLGGQNSSKTPLQITVQPRDARVSTGPVCGNDMCESGETSSSCSSDCPSTTSNTTNVGNDTASVETGCSYSSDCDGYRQICSSGQCIDVECKNNAHCGSHEYCSYNSCVRCRRDYETGAWGC